MTSLGGVTLAGGEMQREPESYASDVSMRGSKFWCWLRAWEVVMSCEGLNTKGSKVIMSGISRGNIEVMALVEGWEADDIGWWKTSLGLCWGPKEVDDMGRCKIQSEPEVFAHDISVGFTNVLATLRVCEEGDIMPRSPETFLLMTWATLAPSFGLVHMGPTCVEITFSTQSIVLC